MAQARLTVRHLMMTRLCRSDPSVPRWSLLGVDFLLIIPAELEFPRYLPYLDVFIRFAVKKAGVGRFRVRVEWDNELVRSTDESLYPFVRRFPDSEVYFDTAVRIQNLQLPGRGRYRLRLQQRQRQKQLGRSVWRTLGTEYFFVEKHA